jgi:hypothetical protein
MDLLREGRAAHKAGPKNRELGHAAQVTAGSREGLGLDAT